jgi:F-type H+-transporting ATPase subunit b
VKRRLLIIAIALIAVAAWSSASAQPEPPAQPPRAQPGPRAQPELPPGHPPVGDVPQQPAQDVAGRRRQIEALLKQQQERGRPGLPGVPPGGGAPLKPGEAPSEAPPEPAVKKSPTDEYGHCIGDGPQDRPKDINLFHGWLGVNNDAAALAPPKGGGEDWWGRNKYFDLGNKEWWTWRLTPHMYRYENHDDHCDPRNQPVPLLANVINVGVLFFLLVRFGKKPVSEALSNRKKSIMAEIEKAAAIKKSAQKRLDEYAYELSHLDERLARLRAQHAAEGVNEEQRIVEDMKDTRRRMMADAEFRISQEGKASRDAMSRDALMGALQAAEDLVSTSLTQADHDRLAEEYLAHIGAALKDGGRS